MADITKEDVIDFIASMSVLELSELVKELEDKFGVSAAAPVAMMAAAPVGGAAGAEQEEALVDEAPKPVKEGIPKDEAEKIKSQLEEAGAQVELK